ncbi:MAG TPA: serine/threonine-protein kinase [Methylomirabilota bacterium]|nr:serine/threonine-protein kinase [Methylomirabilota bacterium]
MSESTEPRLCPQCGSPLPEDSPQGSCPKCLLNVAAAPTETGATTPGRFEPPTVEEVAAAFPNLEIMEIIGWGGMGAVYKVRQPRLDRFAALKVLPKSLSSDTAFAGRFAREGQMLARLNHPNIVAVFDFGQADGFYFLLMEYVDGVNLRQAMRAGRFSPARALALVPGICDALQYAHDEGVLHRDIKPENILLDTRGRVKIADFGIAKLLTEAEGGSAPLTAQGAALGTPHYMAPEQLEKPSDVDARADIYSLGVVFYEMLTGELPMGRFAPPSLKTPVDPRVDAVVMKALERERERRQQTAGEVRTQVESITSSGRDPRTVGREQTGTAPGAPAVQGPPPLGAAGKGRQWSGQAVWGGVLVGISLVASLPLGLIVSMIASWVLARQPDSGTPDSTPEPAARLFVVILLPMLFAILPALAGTLLGWFGLKDIRRSEGRLKGQFLATAAALTWPLLIANFLVVLLLMALLSTAGIAMVLIPLGWLVVLAGNLLITVKTARWGLALPRGVPLKHFPEKRGSVIGTAVGLTVVLALFWAPVTLLVPYMFLSRSAAARDVPTRAELLEPVLPLESMLVEGTFSVSPGEVATFVPLLLSNDVPVRLPELAVFAAAPSGHSLVGHIRWHSTESRPGFVDVVIQTSGGHATSGGLPTPQEILGLRGARLPDLDAPPSTELRVWLERPDADGAGVFGVEIRSQPHRLPIGVVVPEGVIGSGTNWMDDLQTWREGSRP